MRAIHHLIDSPQLGRQMHVWQYGHFGPPVLVFPSAAGFAHEWHAQGMIEAAKNGKVGISLMWANG